MVKDLKYIIKRVLIGTLIALALMYFKGGLIGNVYAQTQSFGAGGQYYQSLENFEIVANISEAPFKNLNPGYLTFSVSIWNWSPQIGQTQYSQVLANIYATANGGNEYACSFNGVSNSKDIEEAQQNLYTIPLTATYSVSCYIEPGSGGLTQIRAYGFGIDNKANWRINTPITFTESDYATISQSTQNIDNSINDESDANTSGFLEDVQQDYSNNPVSDLITMPITFLQRLNNNINGSCTTWNLGSLLGTNLTMPCINLSQILGSTLYNLIDMAICLFLAYNLGLMCVTIWNNMTSLKDDFDDMYSPKHAYNGKHGGGS